MTIENVAAEYSEQELQIAGTLLRGLIVRNQDSLYGSVGYDPFWVERINYVMTTRIFENLPIVEDLDWAQSLIDHPSPSMIQLIQIALKVYETNDWVFYRTIGRGTLRNMRTRINTNPNHPWHDFAIGTLSVKGEPHRVDVLVGPPEKKGTWEETAEDPRMTRAALNLELQQKEPPKSKWQLEQERIAAEQDANPEAEPETEAVLD